MNPLRGLVSLLIPLLAAQNLQTRHIDEHRRLFADFDQRLKANPRDAMAFARNAVTEATRLPRDDPRRGDALEMLCLALMNAGDTGKMLVPATELVRIRKAVKPPEPEIEALALGFYAVALF